MNPREVQLFLAGQALSLIYTPSPATIHEKSGLSEMSKLRVGVNPVSDVAGTLLLFGVFGLTVLGFVTGS